MTTPPTDVARLDSLTGLRFFAALAVFAYHAVGVPQSDLLRRIGQPGIAGVSFFFVLSGFVLAWAATSSEVGSRAAFLRRRAARILPAYWVAWASGLLVVAVEGGDLLAETGRALLGLPLLQAWHPDQDVHYAGNGVGWSLSVEAFFYVCFPFLLAALRRAARRTVARVLALCVVLVVGWPALLRPDGSEGLAFWAVYIAPPARLPEFAAGLCLALLLRDGMRAPVGLPVALLLAAGAYAASGSLPLWAGYAAVTVVPFLLVVAAAADADRRGRRTPFASRPLVVLGEWSYCFYLLHQLVIRLLAQRFPPETSPTSVSAAAALVALVLSVAAAAVLHRLVERPAERRWRAARR